MSKSDISLRVRYSRELSDSEQARIREIRDESVAIDFPNTTAAQRQAYATDTEKGVKDPNKLVGGPLRNRRQLYRNAITVLALDGMQSLGYLQSATNVSSQHRNPRGAFDRFTKLHVPSERAIGSRYLALGQVGLTAAGREMVAADPNGLSIYDLLVAPHLSEIDPRRTVSAHTYRPERNWIAYLRARGLERITKVTDDGRVVPAVSIRHPFGDNFRVEQEAWTIGVEALSQSMIAAAGKPAVYDIQTIIDTVPFNDNVHVY